jgi:hypothetical protein
MEMLSNSYTYAVDSLIRLCNCGSQLHSFCGRTYKYRRLRESHSKAYMYFLEVLRDPRLMKYLFELNQYLLNLF